MATLVPQPAGLKIEDFNDLVAYANQMGKPDWLITNLIERQSRTILAGAEGAGKSLLAFTAAAQAAAQVPILGNPDWCAPDPVRTLYVELEMGKRTISRRARSMNAALASRGFPIPRNLIAFHRIDALDPNQRRSKETGALLDYIGAFEPDLVVFDPLYKMLPTDAAKEGDFGPLMRFLDDVRRTGAAIWIVHHLRKAQNGAGRGEAASDLFGSSFLLRFPELVAFVHDDGDTRGRLEVKKDREGFFEDQGRQFFLRRGGDWPIGVVPLSDPASLIGQITRVLQIDGAKSATALSKELGIRKQQVFGALDQMQSDGWIERVGTGPRTAWAVAEGYEKLLNVVQMFPDPPPENGV